MNDEAGPHYSEMIDQLTVGHLWLLETFSVKPNVSFSNDPFGHASTQAFLFKLAGFDAMFINRIPKDEKQKRYARSRVKEPYLASFIYLCFFNQTRRKDFGIRLAPRVGLVAT
jgi:hypothetical protein